MHYGLSLFVVYLLILALIPCSDELAVISEAAPAHMHAQNSEHEHPDSDHEDHCTPFCICACCGAVLDAPPTLLTLEEEPIPLPPKSSTQPRAVPNWTPGSYADGNWQPPRFA